ncbi:MAG: hypothetical protein E6356_11020 [Terrisporobacter othiniensis]|uniref:hypothetical protein n=1 Tax=Terrisporobacter petrolearius TaxID=1460447 RepID=UPI00290BE300|nr:hypothetical protein [Terrisporobacter othiniensis]MDU6995378.1 hypothetical protein [Terrisporobacter othiniensis]
MHKKSIAKTTDLTPLSPESDKLYNLQSRHNYFGFKNKLSAYDYVNRYNGRVDKVIKIYNQIKKVLKNDL